MLFWRRLGKWATAGLLLLASVAVMAQTYPSARFSRLVVDTGATVGAYLAVGTGTNWWSLLPRSTGTAPLELNPTGTSSGGFGFYDEVSASDPASFSPGTDTFTYGAFLGNASADRCGGSISNCQWAGLYLRSFVPSSTTSALYNASGTLYWNGSPVGTTNFSGGIGLSGSTAQNHGITMASGVPTSTTYALYNSSGSLYWNGTQVATGAGYSGSGTNGALMKWTGTSSFGDSIITESGAIATITGSLTITAQPYVRVYKTADQTGFSTGTYAVLTFNAEDTDSPNWHDNSTNNSRITVATAGTYLVGGTYQLTDSASGGGGFGAVMLRKNAAGNPASGTFLCDQNGYGPTGAVFPHLTLACVVPLAANDYIEAFAQSGQPTTSLIVEGGAVTDSHLMVVKLF